MNNEYNKYHMENDKVQLGDLVHPKEVSNGKEAWDYFWRNPHTGADWCCSHSDNLLFSSKDAAKRGISRLVKRFPTGWRGSEFMVGKVCET